MLWLGLHSDNSAIVQRGFGLISRKDVMSSSRKIQPARAYCLGFAGVELQAYHGWQFISSFESARTAG